MSVKASRYGHSVCKRHGRVSLLFTLFIVVLFSLTACEVKRPREVLTDAKLEEVLFDYHLAKVMADEVPYSESYRKPLYRDAVLAKHGITSAQFDSSMVWFARNPEHLSDIYKRLTERMKKQRDVINDLIALRDTPKEEMPSGDSVEVWSLKRFIILSGMPLNCKQQFQLIADTTFYERDSLCFLLDYRYVGLMPDTLHFAVMGLTLHFRNDSILHQCQPLTAHAGKAELVIQSDTLGEIRSVSGFVYLPQSESGALMRINRMKVMRYHAKDSLKLDKDSLNFSTVEKKEPIQSVPTSIKESSVDKPNTPTTPQRATDRLRQRHASPAAQKSIAAPQKAAVHTPARRVPQGSRPDTLSSGPKGRRQLMLPPKERQQGTPRKTQRMQQPQKIEME